MSAPLRRFRHDVLYLSLRALFALGRPLPLRLLQTLGSCLGSAACSISRRDRRRAADHVRLAFPELPEPEQVRLVSACARHLGKSLGEVVWLWGASAEDVGAVSSFDGVEHLEQALEQGRGANLVTGHCGNWEMLNACLGAAGMPMTAAVRASDDKRIDRMATALRARHGAEVVARGRNAGRRLVRALANNRVNGLLIDQDIRDIPGVFVPFFGRPAWTPSGAATLALRLRIPLIPAFIHRLPDGSHRVETHAPLPKPESGSLEDRVVELTAAATAAIERQIRAHPEQWVWMHRRWKTRPEDESGSVPATTTTSTGDA